MIPTSNLLFWDVDTQVDFMSPQWKLYVAGAENIVPCIQHLNAWAASHKIQIVSSMDAHVPTDTEFQSYPPHCLVGTSGQKKVGGTMLPRHFTIPNHAIALPPDLCSFEQIIVEKQATDVFTNPNMEALLALVALGKHIVLYGVVTEICVHKTAQGLIQRGYRVHIVSDAIQHLEQTAAQATLDEFQKSGGRLFTTKELFKQESA